MSGADSNAQAEADESGDADGESTEPEPPATSSARRAVSSSALTDAQREAKANYDAKPKVIIRGVETETYLKLRAMYRRQLRDHDGILGWSEWGRQLLAGIIASEELRRGVLDTDAGINLPTGRPPKTG